jgi:transcriptional regulator with XRE-family HTH domain
MPETDTLLMKAIGERVRLARMRHGWNQKQFADITGIRQGNLSRIEKGQYLSMHPSRLLALAETLGVSLDYLFGRVDEEQNGHRQPPAPRPRRRQGAAGAAS